MIPDPETYEPSAAILFRRRVARLREGQRRRRALAALACVALVAGVIDGERAHPNQWAAGRAAALLSAPRLRALAPPPPPGHGPRARERRAVERVRGYTPLVSRGGRRGREIALTFDDGPGPFTGRLVRVLRQRHVAATFFQVGQMIAAFPAAARAVARNFPVGDHTLSHTSMGVLPRADQVNQVLEGALRMRSVEGGRFPVLFRPPYASFNPQTLEVLRGVRMLMVLWDVDSEDYTRPGARQIVRNVVSRARPGSIVLMHDAGGDRSQTIAALPAIVRRLRHRGYHFVTVPRMMLRAPPRPVQKVPHGAGR